MSQIAIIGTLGAGKAVFISVLAMGYRLHKDKVRLEYKTAFAADITNPLRHQSGVALSGNFP